MAPDIKGPIAFYLNMPVFSISPHRKTKTLIPDHNVQLSSHREQRCRCKPTSIACSADSAQKPKGQTIR